MIVGCYFKDGTAVSAPLEQAAQVIGVSEYAIRMALEGKQQIPGLVVCKLPNESPIRIPEKCPKVGKKGAMI